MKLLLDQNGLLLHYLSRLVMVRFSVGVMVRVRVRVRVRPANSIRGMFEDKG